MSYPNIIQKMRNEKREQWKSQVERKLSKWKGRTKAGWTEIYYAAAAGKEDWGIRQAAVFNLMWPHVRFVLWSHICVRSSENLYSEVFNNYGMSENLGAMHNAHASALIHSCSLFSHKISIFFSPPVPVNRLSCLLVAFLSQISK